MKRALGILVAMGSMVMAASGAEVVFSTYQLSGAPNNRPIQIEMDGDVVLANTNLFYSRTMTLQPVAGMARTNLVCANYIVILDGKRLKMPVPAGDGVYSAAELITSGATVMNAALPAAYLQQVQAMSNAVQSQVSALWATAASLSGATNAALGVISQSGLAYLSQLVASSNAVRELAGSKQQGSATLTNLEGAVSIPTGDYMSILRGNSGIIISDTDSKVIIKGELVAEGADASTFFKSNTIPPARLGTGASGNKFLRADSTYAEAMSPEDSTNAAATVLSQSSVAYIAWLAASNTALQQLVLDATNTMANAARWAQQTGSDNLTNWASLNTNVLGSISSTGAVSAATVTNIVDVKVGSASNALYSSISSIAGTSVTVGAMNSTVNSASNSLVQQIAAIPSSTNVAVATKTARGLIDTNQFAFLQTLPGVNKLANGGLPPMGWISYIAYPYPSANEPTEDKMRTVAARIRTNGMYAMGYKYLVIDEGWQGTRQTNGMIGFNTNFPNGVRPLIDYVHGLGMKLGLYMFTSPFANGGSPGSHGYWREDAAWCVTNGVDYVKLEGFDIPASPYTSFMFQSVIQESGRDIFTCIGGDHFEPWMRLVGNSWRYAGSLADVNGWTETVPWWDAGLQNNWGNGLGQFTEMDEIKNEYACKTRMSMCAILPAPILISELVLLGNPNDLDSNNQWYTNSTVIAINQDPGHHPGFVVSSNAGVQIVKRPLGDIKDGIFSVLAFSRNVFATNFACYFTNLGIAADAQMVVEDAWNRTNHTATGSFPVALGIGSNDVGVQLFRLTPLAATGSTAALVATNDARAVNLSGRLTAAKVGPAQSYLADAAPGYGVQLVNEGVGLGIGTQVRLNFSTNAASSYGDAISWNPQANNYGGTMMIEAYGSIDLVPSLAAAYRDGTAGGILLGAPVAHHDRVSLQFDDAPDTTLDFTGQSKLLEFRARYRNSGGTAVMANKVGMRAEVQNTNGATDLVIYSRVPDVNTNASGSLIGTNGTESGGVEVARFTPGGISLTGTGAVAITIGGIVQPAITNTGATDQVPVWTSSGTAKWADSSGGSGATLVQVTNAAYYILGQNKTNRLNVLDFGADPYFTIDSTAAFQAAINAAATLNGTAAAQNSEIKVPAGHYKILGTLVFPDFTTYSFTNYSTIELVGEFPVPMYAGTIPNGPLPIVGSVVEFWAANTNCVMVKIRTDQPPYQFVPLEPRFRNIDFRQSDYVNARTMFNFTNAISARFEGCGFNHTNWQGAFSASLPNLNNIYVDGPAVNEGNTFTIRNCNFIGAGQGLRIAEHGTIDFINIGALRYGVTVKANNLGSTATRITAQGCNYPIYFEGTGGLNVQMLVNEKIAAGWMTNIADIGGGSASIGYGEIGIHVMDDVGSQHNGIRNLQQNVHVTNLRDGARWFTDSAGSSAITRGPKVIYQPASQAAYVGGMTLLKHNETSTFPKLPSPVSVYQGMMALKFGGWSGAAGDIAPAAIESVVDGAVASGSIPTALRITTGATDNPTAERIRWTSGGMTIMATNMPQTTSSVAGGIGFWNSNGTATYILKSSTGSFAWSSTNLWF